MTTRILIGDVRERLKSLPVDYYDTVVTSPPYWGLRDYGVPGQLGLEPTLGEHLAVMVDVFNEVRRVLKPSGTLWLNYGDCYATTPNGRSAADTKAAGNDDRTFRDKPFSTIGPIYEIDESPRNRGRQGRSGNLGNGAVNGGNLPGGRVVAGGALKPKDLCMIPNRLAIALQDAGWWVRSEIIWGKPNAMPDSSGRYRPATSHEKIFLLAKSDQIDWWIARDTGEISATPDLSERCQYISAEGEGPRWIGLGHYYNAEAVRVEQAPATVERLAQNLELQIGSDRAFGGKKHNGRMKAVGRNTNGGKLHSPYGRHTLGNEIPERERRLDKERGHQEFSARPDKQRGHSRRHNGFNDRWDAMTVEEQGANGRLLRNYEPAPLRVWPMATAAYKEAHFATFPPELVERCLWAGCPPGGRVLDPFGGAGTTALVADRMGLDCDLIELNSSYALDAERRIRAEVPMFAEIEMVVS